MRFLSHAETVRVFQRACIRAGVEIRYSQGFNPRPRMSLPLPRPVGVEADGDLFCFQSAQLGHTIHDIQDRLSSQLPEGFELLSIEAAEDNNTPHPSAGSYVLELRRDVPVLQKDKTRIQEYPAEKLKTTIKRLLTSESVILQRRKKTINSKIKTVDVRSFLKSITLDNGVITVECKITPAGSIRIDEILKLLKLDYTMLAAPIRRTNVQWKEQVAD